MEFKVRKWRAPGELDMSWAAWAKLVAALTSPSELMIVARFSRSASACLAMVRTMFSGSSMSFSSTASTSMPQGSVVGSMDLRISVAISSRLLRSSSSVTSPAMRRMVV